MSASTSDNGTPVAAPIPQPSVTTSPVAAPTGEPAQAVVELPDRPATSTSSSDTPLYLQPVLLAAIIALLGTLAALWMNNRFHRERLKFEEKLADKKYAHDVSLGEREFSHTVGMAKWHRQSDFAEEKLAAFYEAHARLTSIRSPAS